MIEQIRGGAIEVGDVIRSAAMRRPERVYFVSPSSTGRTVEVATRDAGGFQHVYRIGATSKVRRYGREGR